MTDNEIQVIYQECSLAVVCDGLLYCSSKNEKLCNSQCFRRKVNIECAKEERKKNKLPPPRYFHTYFFQKNGGAYARQVTQNQS